MDLSIIVPVYNVEAYLDKCLKSLVQQTLEAFRYEIIVINDGSTDHSQKIIDFYANKYDNVRSYQKENGGLSDARNYGIERAEGKYIAFVDSDDYVKDSMYKTMLEKAEQRDFDIVVCDFIEVRGENESFFTSRLKHDIMEMQGIKKTMCDIYPSAWNKLYKRSLFDNLRFKKGVWFEDVECLYRIFPLIQSIGVVKHPLYYYVQRKGSISKSVDVRIYHCIDNWNELVYYYQNHKQFWNIYKKEIEYCYVRYLFATFINAVSKFDKKAYDQAVEKALVNVKMKFPHYRRNKYFYRSVKGWYLLTFNRFYANILFKHKKG